MTVLSIRELEAQIETAMADGNMPECRRLMRKLDKLEADIHLTTREERKVPILKRVLRDTSWTLRQHRGAL